MKVIAYDLLKTVKGIGYSRDHLRRKVKAGEFPAPIAISDSRIAWIEAEIDHWLEAKVAQRSTRLGMAPNVGVSVREKEAA